jgi:HK97 family phage portal protein
MTFLDTIRARAARPTKADAPIPIGRLTAAASYERSRLPDLTTSEKQANLYANLTWMQIAVGVLAQTIATAAFEVQERTGEEVRAVKNHPFELRLAQPNDDQSDYDLIEATVSWRAITGNCYWWLNRTGPDVEPEEIWIIPSYQIEPVPDGRMGVKGYAYDPGDGIKVPLEPWEIVHFKTYNPLSRLVGLSAVQALALDAIGDIAAQKYNTGFYAQDNAKPDGILAFADAIDDPRWKRIQEDWKEQHGGTKQKRMAMLRSVGAGGVQWIQTQLSRVEIQYLEQRTFTKEEIFSRMAPGLASILAVNATEANSTAGKDTFLSMAVYPVTVALAKTVTVKIIRPVYGDQFLATFEDVRRVDTQIELLEQAEFSKTHTVDEIRAKYYQDTPIGDERGALLPAEIGSGLTDARPPEEKQAMALEIMQQRAEQAPPEPPTPGTALADAGKALDRKRWRAKAMKAIAAGRGADVPFDPDYLSDGEAMEIRAALKSASDADAVWRALGEG